MKPNFILINKLYPFVFPVPPKVLKIQTAQTTVNVDLIDFGEKVNIGERQCDRISFETFLPHTSSQFFQTINPLAPLAGVTMLKNWASDKAALTFLVPEMLITYKCSITNLDYSLNDKTGDIYISLQLVERRQQNKVTDNVTGLFSRL